MSSISVRLPARGRSRALVSGACSAALLVSAVGVTVASPAAATAAAKPTATAVPFHSASVVHQDADAYLVTWRAPGAGRVRVFRAGLSGPTGPALARGAAAGHVTVHTSDAHPAFDLVPDRGGQLTLTERSLGIASAPNFRDAGGYRTSNGKWVRMGVLYRSNVLALNPADKATVDTLGVSTVYDLRTPAEATKTPDVLPIGATRVSLNVTGTDSPASPSLTTPQDGINLLVDGEKSFVTGASPKQAYTALFNGLAQHDGAQIINCSAGKDRTGWAAAVLLSILGVPRETIMRDYLLSNTYLSATNAASLAAMPAAMQPIYAPLLGVDAAYLQAGFDQADASYGSMDGYVRQGLGLTPATIAALKRKLLVG